MHLIKQCRDCDPPVTNLEGCYRIRGLRGVNVWMMSVILMTADASAFL